MAALSYVGRQVYSTSKGSTSTKIPSSFKRFILHFISFGAAGFISLYNVHKVDLKRTFHFIFKRLKMLMGY